MCICLYVMLNVPPRLAKEVTRVVAHVLLRPEVGEEAEQRGGPRR